MRVAGVVAVLPSLAVGVLGAAAPAWRSRRRCPTRTPTPRQLVGIQDVRNDLVVADATATNAFLVGGLEPPEQRARYDEADRVRRERARAAGRVQRGRRRAARQGDRRADHVHRARRAGPRQQPAGLPGRCGVPRPGVVGPAHATCCPQLDDAGADQQRPRRRVVRLRRRRCRGCSRSASSRSRCSSSCRCGWPGARTGGSTPGCSGRRSSRSSRASAARVVLGSDGAAGRRRRSTARTTTTVVGVPGVLAGQRREVDGVVHADQARLRRGVRGDVRRRDRRGARRCSPGTRSTRALVAAARRLGRPRTRRSARSTTAATGTTRSRSRSATAPGAPNDAFDDVLDRGVDQPGGQRRARRTTRCPGRAARRCCVGWLMLVAGLLAAVLSWRGISKRVEEYR